MFAILTNTIYQKRWSLAAWGAVAVAMVALIVSVFHSFSGGSFDTTLKQLPQSLQGIIGSTASYSTINGFINQQIFVKTFPILTLVFAIILFSGVLAGEESDGTLQVLLAQPVSRTRVLLQKLFAGIILSGFLCLIVALACISIVPLIHESVSVGGLLTASFSLWLVTLVFGLLAFMLGAATGKRGLAGSIAGGLAFAFYLVSSLAVGVKSLQKIDNISPFHYYGTSRNVITDGLQLKSVLVLGGLICACGIVALVVFRKRDIYQR